MRWAMSGSPARLNRQLSSSVSATSGRLPNGLPNDWESCRRRNPLPHQTGHLHPYHSCAGWWGPVLVDVVQTIRFEVAQCIFLGSLGYTPWCVIRGNLRVIRRIGLERVHLVNDFPRIRHIVAVGVKRSTLCIEEPDDRRRAIAVEYKRPCRSHRSHHCLWRSPCRRRDIGASARSQRRYLPDTSTQPSCSSCALSGSLGQLAAIVEGEVGEERVRFHGGRVDVGRRNLDRVDQAPAVTGDLISRPRTSPNTHFVNPEIAANGGVS